MALLYLQGLTGLCLQVVLLTTLVSLGQAGRAFPQKTENYVQELFHQINPSLEWDPTNFLVDLSGRYALCRSARHRGQIKIPDWTTQDGGTIGGLTDYTPGQLSHVGAVAEYLRNALPVWIETSPYKEQIQHAKRFGCSVQPRCKGFVIFTCLFSPGYGAAPPTPKPDTDECLRGNAGCQHQCHNIPGSYYCSCFRGYTLQPDRHTCAREGTNECLVDNGGCDHGCVDTESSYYCTCRAGWSLQQDRRTCAYAEEDKNECLVNNGGCAHICTDTKSSYYCSCRAGYRLQEDRRTCAEEDTNECLVDNGGCEHDCHNTQPGYYCSCRAGYSLQADRRTCAYAEEDKNECLVDNGGCEHECHNTPSSFYCSCRAGYRLQQDRRTCAYAEEDNNECLSNNGGCDHVCHNTQSSYYCSCRLGYYLLPDRHRCAEEATDNCAANNGGCDHTCHNTPTSYYCSCRAGYQLQPDRHTCRQEPSPDENECARQNGGCQHICRNTVGSYYCACRPGYTLAADRKSCRDIDECARNNGGCDHNCHNTPGSYYCSCRRGYNLQPDQRTCLGLATPPPIVGKQLALAFTRQEYDLAEGVTLTKWDRSHFLENLSGYETSCDMIGRRSWDFNYAKVEAKKWKYDVDGLFGSVKHGGSTSNAIISILKSWPSIPTKEVGCSVIPDCVRPDGLHVVVSCVFRIPEGGTAASVLRPAHRVDDDLEEKSG